MSEAPGQAFDRGWGEGRAPLEAHIVNLEREIARLRGLVETGFCNGYAAGAMEAQPGREEDVDLAWECSAEYRALEGGEHG